VPAALLPILFEVLPRLVPGLDLSDPSLARIPDLLSYLLLQGLPVLVVGAALLPKTRHFVRVLGLGPSPLRSASTFRLVAGLFALDSLLSMAFYELEKLGGSIDTRDFLNAYLIDAPLDGLLHELAVAAVIAPVGEEILFRGFLFNAWRSRAGFWPAALASSLIFGGMHFYSWFGMATIVAFGLFACWIYERCGSLWPPILLHALTNFTLTLGAWYVWSEFPSPG
jgi:membrane protease YdiL (CAAX protease family)